MVLWGNVWTVYDFVVGFVKTHSYSPTQDEISIGTNLDPKTVRRSILALSNRGFITYETGKPRTIVVKGFEDEYIA